ncbi:MAG: hypothetical protein JWR74_2979 [Polaromonas sp.]|nr:hypothetical protein [Polaromonas sp.]
MTSNQSKFARRIDVAQGMKWVHAIWLAGVLIMASFAACAAGTWLTLVGNPADAASDYVQFDPASLAYHQGVPELAVRVSRARPRTSKEGITFRSFDGVVAVDCEYGTARFLRAAFYANPDFQGEPTSTVVFGPSDIRPMAFREIAGEPTQRVVRAACGHSAVKSVS